LVLDVEGWELDCLKGFSFGRFSPQVAIIENLFHDSSLIEFMRSRRYVLWRRIDPNDIYVHSSSPKFEDVLLERSLRHVSDGLYTDIGAYRPTSALVTRCCMLEDVRDRC